MRLDSPPRGPEISACGDRAAPGLRSLSFRNLQYRLEYAVFRAVAWIATALPVETASNLSARLWGWIAPLLKRHSRALNHLRLAFPEKSEAERKAIALDMWRTLGRIFAEAFHIDEILDSNRVVFENVDELTTLGVAEMGAIGCGAHLGNWEVAASMAGALHLDAMGIYQRIKNPHVDAHVRAMRARLYPAGLLPKEPATGLKAIRHVRNGGALVMLADLRDRNGKPVPFFGLPAPSTSFPAMLARTLDRPLLAVQVIREPGVRFRVRGVLVDVPRTDNRDADVERATENLQRTLEGFIRQNPSQWMWAHRRWG